MLTLTVYYCTYQVECLMNAIKRYLALVNREQDNTMGEVPDVSQVIQWMRAVEQDLTVVINRETRRATGAVW